jgi:hypothetical protein
MIRETITALAAAAVLVGLLGLYGVGYRAGYSVGHGAAPASKPAAI